MEERKEFEEKEHSEENAIIIPLIQEQVMVFKIIIDTSKLIIRKRVTKEETTLAIPLVHESYTVEHVLMGKMGTLPPVRQEGDTTIISVVREVQVVQKRFDVVEEVHVTKQRTAVPHVQQITLRKEKVEGERKPLQDNNQRY